MSIATLVSPVNAQRVAVAAMDIPRGKTLTGHDILWVTNNRRDNSDSDSESDSTATAKTNSDNAPIGWITRKTVKKGEKLEIPAVTKPDVILTGDKVRAVYQTNDVSVAVDGVAISRGAVGDTVFIRLQNRKRVRGRIESNATISIL